jgi:hypothetical protein
LERAEAIALLKQILALNLALPSMVALNQNKKGAYDLVLRGDCDIQPIKEFAAEQNLAVKWDKEKSTCIIYKP